MTNSHIIKTFGPIHFEDLDPHRFEDLVREIVYDFRDWQKIEATGRGGSDDGFDIRAFEKADISNAETDEINSNEDVPFPVEGRVWMFQCKREKEIGPKRICSIVSEGVNPQSPPHGYILAAPANFSKTCYDKFRDELIKKGVMEFYLWGRAELEDMLHQPKNDHILFTFFGISLISKRKTRATEIRAVVSSKNKLLKLLGDDPAYKPVLVRDSKDVNYPYKEKIKDFKNYPRWSEFPVMQIHPLGLILQVKKHFAFYDSINKTWDYTDAINLILHHVQDDNNEIASDLHDNVQGFWELFQKSHQVWYVKLGLIRFDAMLVIDGEGDSKYKFPHIYVDFEIGKGPFGGFYEFLEINEHYSEKLEGLNKIEIFPKIFSKPLLGTIHRNKKIILNENTRAQFDVASRSKPIAIYDCDNKFAFLKQGDVIEIDEVERHDKSPILIKVTNIRKERGKDILKLHNENSSIIYDRSDNPLILHIELQIGRKLTQKDIITIYEFKEIYEWQLVNK